MSGGLNRQNSKLPLGAFAVCCRYANKFPGHNLTLFCFSGFYEFYETNPPRSYFKLRD